VLNKQSLFFCDPYFDDALTKPKKKSSNLTNVFVVNGEENGDLRSCLMFRKDN